ncbi:DUF998 domain-containing protein [Streptomyces sp. NPDC058294]|uniref:DUF998 domain-containing protein n=1 Tax=Streptomyces sp. NPDC058294 TaxID=3346430 RepID=UPI0036E8F8FC
MIAVSAVAAYIVLDVIAQLLPPHYSAVHQPESNLGVGPYSWVMNLNFLVRGVTGATIAWAVFTKATRTRQKVGAALLAVWAACSALLSVIHTDVSSGSLATTDLTTQGTIHVALAFIGFACAAVGTLTVGTGLSNHPRALHAVALSTAIALLLFLAATVTTDLFGLFERLFIATVLAWTTLTALSLTTAALDHHTALPDPLGAR